MQRYKVVVVCCTADETDVHTIRVNGWGESEAEYNAAAKSKSSTVTSMKR